MRSPSPSRPYIKTGEVAAGMKLNLTKTKLYLL